MILEIDFNSDEALYIQPRNQIVIEYRHVSAFGGRFAAVGETTG